MCLFKVLLQSCPQNNTLEKLCLIYNILDTIYIYVIILCNNFCWRCNSKILLTIIIHSNYYLYHMFNFVDNFRYIIYIIYSNETLFMHHIPAYTVCNFITNKLTTSNTLPPLFNEFTSCDLRQYGWLRCM